MQDRGEEIQAIRGNGITQRTVGFRRLVTLESGIEVPTISTGVCINKNSIAVCLTEIPTGQISNFEVDVLDGLQLFCRYTHHPPSFHGSARNFGQLFL